jgi:hypothetical protein
MNYYIDEGLPTLELALDSMAAEELRKLAALTGQKVPSRKGDMAALIVQYLAGERLHTVWEGLDELQRPYPRLSIRRRRGLTPPCFARSMAVIRTGVRPLSPATTASRRPSACSSITA